MLESFSIALQDIYLNLVSGTINDQQEILI